MELKSYDMNYLITYQRMMIDNNSEINDLFKSIMPIIDLQPVKVTVAPANK
jgi:hypothetical protein